MIRRSPESLEQRSGSSSQWPKKGNEGGCAAWGADRPQPQLQQALQVAPQAVSTVVYSGGGPPSMQVPLRLRASQT